MKKSDRPEPSVYKMQRYKKADLPQEFLNDPSIKRFATSVKRGDLVTVSGPATIFVRNIDSRDCELAFLIDREVLISKRNGVE
jgi:hypothetical protein